VKELESLIPDRHPESLIANPQSRIGESVDPESRESRIAETPWSRLPKPRIATPGKSAVETRFAIRDPR
jgi:hypothetical protein